MCVCVCIRLSVVILCEFFNALLVGWQVGVARLKRQRRAGQGAARIGQSSEMCQAVWGTNSVSADGRAVASQAKRAVSVARGEGQGARGERREATQINGKELPAMSIGNDIDSGNDACQI